MLTALQLVSARLGLEQVEQKLDLLTLTKHDFDQIYLSEPAECKFVECDIFKVPGHRHKYVDIVLVFALDRKYRTYRDGNTVRVTVTVNKGGEPQRYIKTGYYEVVGSFSFMRKDGTVEYGQVSLPVQHVTFKRNTPMLKRLMATIEELDIHYTIINAFEKRQRR